MPFKANQNEVARSKGGRTLARFEANNLVKLNVLVYCCADFETSTKTKTQRDSFPGPNANAALSIACLKFKTTKHYSSKYHTG